MKVVLIYELIPEETRAYLIEDPTEEQIRVLEACNNMIIGHDDTTEEMSILCSALDSAENAYEGIAEEWIGFWAGNLVEFPIQGPVDRIYLFGFAL